ncbi:MAG: hypothetical protein L3K04_01015 [Thermoplasmata archaeon]|nr:hypothetical protein [Thermoplasmata archaeon]MCI4340803.1 hypothetical protein [Thermoplasmata archaeon]
MGGLNLDEQSHQPISRSGRSFRSSGGTKWAIVTASAVVVFAIVFVVVLSPLATQPSTGPSSFAPVWGPVQVTPGNVGCPASQGGLCYSVGVTTLYRSVQASSLAFAVSNSTTLQYPMPNNVPMGANATVSIIGGSSAVATWDWSTGSWSSGISYVLPYNTNVTLVLDTGLTSNSTLLGNVFCVELATNGGGVLGFYFH